ncbi:MAG: AraC family ligand binding domain-containing protein [Parachlamydiaceae bacterium]
MSDLPIHKKKKVLIDRPGLKVVHFYLSPGDIIPEHKTNAHVVVTTVFGKGIFTIDRSRHEMNPGVVLEMSPYTLHSINAIEELEFVVVHAHLAHQTGNIHCGAFNATSLQDEG